MASRRLHSLLQYRRCTTARLLSSSFSSSSSPSASSSLRRALHSSCASLAYRPDPTPNDKPQHAHPINPASHTTSSSPSAATPVTSPHFRASSTSIADVLASYQSDGKTFTCLADHTLHEAVEIMVNSRVGCLVAMESDGEHVAGLVTERDILSEMVTSTSAGSNWRQTKVSAAMTRSREMVHIKPSDHIDDALTLMTSQGFRHLPVLETSNGMNHLRGIVSMRNLVDIVYKSQSAGGKAQFLNDILPRTGVPKNTSLRKKGSNSASSASSSATAQDDDCYRSLYLNSGVASRPHPDKKHGEDAYVAFVGDLSASSSSSSSSSSSPHPTSLIAVFDGVGSWSFEQGIDPSKFSNACARAVQKYVNSYGGRNTSQQQRGSITPQSLMDVAWQEVNGSRIVGSSTACIITLSHDSNELRAANIGDSGFLVLRHKDARVRVGSVGHHLASSADEWSVIYRSPQQLHYFNCPLQLGIGKDASSPASAPVASGEAASTFESPADADILNFRIQEGDLIILATDGLFDNVPEETILATLNSVYTDDNTDSKQPIEWKSLRNTAAGEESTSTGATSTPTTMQRVADSLVTVAYDLSVDKTIDSPFAVLAKENNILWKNGGRKDDITVIVARVEAVPRK